MRLLRTLEIDVNARTDSGMGRIGFVGDTKLIPRIKEVSFKEASFDPEHSLYRESNAVELDTDA